jgi:hypothetical protein
MHTGDARAACRPHGVDARRMGGAPRMEAWRMCSTEVAAATHHARRMSAVMSDMGGAPHASAAATPAMATAASASMAATGLGDRLAGRHERAARDR